MMMSSAFFACLGFIVIGLGGWALYGSGKNRTQALTKNPFWADLYLFGMGGCGSFFTCGLLLSIVQTEDFAIPVWLKICGYLAAIFFLLVFLWFIIAWLITFFTPAPFLGWRPRWWKELHHTKYAFTRHKRDTRFKYFASRSFPLIEGQAINQGPQATELSCYTNTTTSQDIYISSFPSNSTHRFVMRGELTGPFTFTGKVPAAVTAENLSYRKSMYFPAEPDVAEVSVRCVDLFVDRGILTFVQVAPDDYVKRHCWVLSLYSLSSADIEVERIGGGRLRVTVPTSDSSRPFVFVSESRLFSRWKSRCGVLEKALDKKRLLPLASGSLVSVQLKVSPYGESVFESGVDARGRQEDYFSEQPVSLFW